MAFDVKSYWGYFRVRQNFNIEADSNGPSIRHGIATVEFDIPLTNMARQSGNRTYHTGDWSPEPTAMSIRDQVCMPGALS